MAESKTKKQETTKKVKAPKVEKKLDASKLPALFKKEFSEKSFEKNIVKKIYVPSDKTFITELFKKAKDKKGNEILKIPAKTEFTKTELNRLKKLAKEIKANKGRFKTAPFIAVAVVLAAVGLTVTIFKNPFAKWAIRSTMEGIFGAKCDISSVNVEILGAQITVNKLAQASSDDEYKNIFELEKIDLNFNLSNVLRGRMHAENIEITGIELGTERKTSGKILIKKADVKKKAEKNDSTNFYESLKARAGSDPEAAKKAITELFAMYDPNAISENIKENFQSKKVAKEVEEELKTIVETWKNKPDEFKGNVSDIQTATKTITGINVSKVTAAEIPALLKEIDEASRKVKTAKENMENSLSSFSTDQKRVNELKQKLNVAIENDKALLSDSLGVLDVKQAREAITNAINQSGYALLGQYYPYLKQLITYASAMKGSGSSKEAKEANEKAVEKAKKESRRFPGRYVFWKTDRVPKLLIERIHGSGNGIDVLATNISSDMNKRGEPWIIKGTYARNLRTHNAGLTVDARDNSTDSLITGTYSGNNFPLTLDFGKSAGSDVVPKFEGISTVNARLNAEADFSFSGSGSVAMSDAAVTAGELGSETASRIYSSALSSIKSLNIGANVDFSEEKGVYLNVSTDFDRLLANAISKVAASEMSNAKNAAMEKLNDQLGDSGNAEKYLGQFADISSQINGQKSVFDSINKQLDAKKAELTKKATSAAAEKASSAVSGAAGSLLNKLKK